MDRLWDEGWRNTLSLYHHNVGNAYIGRLDGRTRITQLLCVLRAHARGTDPVLARIAYSLYTLCALVSHPILRKKLNA